MRTSVRPVAPKAATTAGAKTALRAARVFRRRTDGSASTALRLGGAVNHKKFGPGTVVMIEGQGEHARVQVQFEQAGSKWLVLAYANLEAC